MRPIDIRLYKNEIRDRIKQERRNMDPEVKAEMDKSIAENVRRLYQYKSAGAVLVYVSTPIEVDTRKIIENCWKDGKKVAVPRCIPGTREMEFHYISDFSQLSPGTFSVLEPDAELPIVKDFKGCLMLLPALSIDYLGYRLGYGKGYYDRYLSRFSGLCAVICYTQNIRRHMYHGRFDRPADIIVTDNWIKTVTARRNNDKIGINRRRV